RRQRLECALFSQAVQRGQFPFIHELFGQFGIHAVQAEDDAPFDAAAGKGPAIADRPDEITDGENMARKDPITAKPAPGPI
ncbi:MAG: hypothetical protein ACYSO7_01770, partial [Planctomycetota bacterium]